MKKIFVLTLFCCLTLWSTAQNSAPTDPIITVSGARYYVHTVVAGETIASLARQFEVEASEILKYNPLAAEMIRVGERLKIPVTRKGEKLRRRDIIRHTVNAGETAYGIAHRYGVTIAQLIADNDDFDPTLLRVGQTLLVRKTAQNDLSPEALRDEISEYSRTLSAVDNHYTYHAVKQGETLYGLSKQFGVSIEQLNALNPAVVAEGLKAGVILRIPKPISAEIQPKPTPDNAIPDHTSEAEPPQTVSRHSDGFAVVNSETIRMALLLPLSAADGSINDQFVEFYQGVLVALDTLKNEGVNVQLNLFDTRKNAENVHKIIESGALAKMNLVIGPVYDELFTPVAEYCARREIPVVSPLAVVSNNDPHVFQVAPTTYSRSEALRALVHKSDRVIVVTPESGVDQEFASEIRSVVTSSAVHVDYSKATGIGAIERAIDPKAENLIIVQTANENKTDEILARLASYMNNVVARTGTTPSVKILGSSRWSKFTQVDRSLFFKLNVHYVTAYHADRTDLSVETFDRKYVSLFNVLPSLFSYRGYDVALLFVSALARGDARWTDSLEQPQKFLQSGYQFRRSNGKYLNTHHQTVEYKNNFTIEVY